MGDMCLLIKWFPPMGIFERARGRTRHIKQSWLRTDKTGATSRSQRPSNASVTRKSTNPDDGCKSTATAARTRVNALEFRPASDLHPITGIRFRTAIDQHSVLALGEFLPVVQIGKHTACNSLTRFNLDGE